MVTVPTLTAVASPPPVTVATLASEVNHWIRSVMATGFLFLKTLGAKAR